MTYLFDTDHITIFEQGPPAERAALRARVARHATADLGYSIVSFHEQVLGAHTFPNRARTATDLIRGYVILSKVYEAFAAGPMIPYDAPAAAISNLLRAQGVRIGTMDLRIAAIALSRNLVLLTRNVRDFAHVPGLVTEDWTA